MIWQTLLGLTSFAFLVSFGRHVAVQAGGQVLRVRGIPSSMALLYSPERDFECLDGSVVLPFTRINDDYCDCGDGSDEPGTAACTNGSFYCQNTGYQASYIPSSWVNDGVCDCCDASDEYSSNVQCIDICHDLGREAWLEAQRIAELAKEGNKIRLEYISKGKQLKTDNQAKLAKLRIDLDETELIKKERENEKLKIEELETAALEKYKPAPQPEPEADAGNENADAIRRADTENDNGDFIDRADAENDDASYTVQAERYFKVLDTDESGTVTVAELQAKKVFDKNRDGVVSKEEALFFLNNNEEITQEEFVKLAWPNVKPYLMLDKGLFKHKPSHLNEIRKQEEEEEEEAKEPDVQESSKPESNRHQRRSEIKEEQVNQGMEQEQEQEEEVVDEEEEEEEVEEEEEEDDEQRAEAEIQRRAAELEEGGDGQVPEPEPETTPEPPPQYDEETQMIVDEASKARERYQETEREVQDLLSEIRKLEERAERDYGQDEEFAVLDGQCFEYADLEYIYSLCPYGRTSQRSKNGGSEVSLGHWSDWVGPQGNRYTAAKFDRGLTCWNGPARTCYVHLRCGVENKLLQVSEPSRCEYAMEFATPALCNPSNVGGEVHDEL